MTKNRLIFHIAPGVLYIALILLFFINLNISRTRPVIDAVSPIQLKPGDTGLILGRNFGRERGKSKVYLDNVAISPSFIESWSDTTLKLRLPPVKTSGLIAVETGGGRSPGAVFILSQRIPELAPAAFLSGKPHLEGINSNRFLPGQMVVLQGDKLGEQQRNSRILVSLSAETPKNLLDQPNEEEFLAVPHDNIYSWGNEELAFFLPQEAASGPVYVSTESGYSNAIGIELSPGNIACTDTRLVALRQVMNIVRLAAFPGNALVLWFPQPDHSPGLTIVKQKADFDFTEYPVILKNLASLKNETLTMEYELKLQAVNFTLDPRDIGSEYVNREMLQPWLLHEKDLPSGDFRKTALAVIKKEKNLYKQSRFLYDYVLWKMTHDDENPPTDPDSWLSERRCDDLGFASLFVCLNRSVGIAARVVSGLWLPPEADDAIEPAIHHWCEVYFPDFGWFPADPGAANGALDKHGAGEGEKPGGWGVLDNGYIPFSRGREKAVPLYHNGQTLGNCSYSRQELYGELTGHLDAATLVYPLPEIIP